MELAKRLKRQQDETGERQASVLRCLGQKKRIEWVWAELVGIGLKGSREVFHGLIEVARGESRMCSVGVNSNPRECVTFDIGNVEPAHVKRHALDWGG